MSHSQSEPVSLQPRSSTTAVAAQPAPVPSNLLLLQTVEKTVINPESSALMQECSDEEDIILEDVRQATPSQVMPSQPMPTQVIPSQPMPRQATMVIWVIEFPKEICKFMYNLHKYPISDRFR